MTLSNTFSNLTALKTGLSSSSASARGANTLVVGDGSGQSVDVGAVGTAISISTLGLETLLFAYEIFLRKSINAQKNTINEMKQLESNVRGMEIAASRGDDLIELLEILPTIGGPVSNARIEEIVEQIQRVSDRGADVLSSRIKIQENLVASQEKFSATLTKGGLALGAFGVVSGIVLAALEKGEKAADSGASATSALLSAHPTLATDARVVKAFETLEERLSLSTAEAATAATTLNDIIRPLETQLLAAMDNVVAAVGAVTDAVELPIDTFNNIESKIGPFRSGLDALGVPLNSFFNFLENPPKVFGRQLFSPIARTKIQSIIDFIRDIKEKALGFTVFGLLEPILNPVLSPITNAVNNLVGQSVPINDVFEELDFLENLTNGLFDALDGFANVIDEIEAKLGLIEGFDFTINPAFDGDAGVLQRLTYFGEDAAEAVQGQLTASDSARLARTDSDAVGAVLSGGDGNDTLMGTAADDFLLGGADNDLINGGGGEDVLLGGEGADTITGGAGDDVIDGGAGVDIAVFSGARAAYEITLAGGILSVTGPDGADDLVDIETLRFDDGDVDVASLFPSTPPNDGEADGGAGGGTDGGDTPDQPDLVVGDETPDRFLGNDGGDTLLGGAGDDTLVGRAGDDRLIGGADDDLIKGGAGEDLLKGNAGDDTLNGGGGDDVIRGGGGSDNVRGGGGGDDIKGNGGADIIKGNGGNDAINGGGGADVITGGRGDDTMQGGGGADRFVFGSNDGDDTITRFQQGIDVMEFRGAQDFDDFDIRQTGDGALISFRNTSVLIEGENRNAVTEDDFIF